MAGGLPCQGPEPNRREGGHVWRTLRVDRGGVAFIGDKRRNPKLILLENVLFVLLLDQGAAVMLLSERLERIDAVGRAQVLFRGRCGQMLLRGEVMAAALINGH
jgi:hypothetical protein